MDMWGWVIRAHVGSRGGAAVLVAAFLVTGGALTGCAGGPDGTPTVDGGRGPGHDCMQTGCSGQLCAEDPVVSTCEWRPEYACYRGVTCTRQPSGVCGFAARGALDQCLEQHRKDGCFFRGVHRPVASTFPAEDGCNQCSCTGAGQVTCTLQVCADAGT